MDFETMLPEIATRTEKKQRRKELEKRRPRTFEQCVLRFWNEMSCRGSRNYTVDELARFVESGVTDLD
jgi:hypothetical protein